MNRQITEEEIQITSKPVKKCQSYKRTGKFEPQQDNTTPPTRMAKMKETDNYKCSLGVEQQEFFTLL